MNVAHLYNIDGGLVIIVIKGASSVDDLFGTGGTLFNLSVDDFVDHRDDDTD